MPVLRLCRDHRRARDGTCSGSTTAQRCGAPKRGRARRWPNFAMRASPSRPTSTRCSANCSPAGGSEAERHDDEPTLGRTRLLFAGSDWDFETLSRAYDAIEQIAVEELALDIYPEPDRDHLLRADARRLFLDRHAADVPALVVRQAFPITRTLYRRRPRGLAYEIVINSNPCITYLMEENTMAMQALVIAHAAFGHNHFFKNNYLFRQWTDAGAILGYLDFAKGYIAALRGTPWHPAVERDPRRRPCADGAGRDPLSPRRRGCPRTEKSASCATGWNTRSDLNDLWRRCRRRRDERDGERTRPSERRRCSICPRRTCSISWRRHSPSLEALAARDPAHRARHRAIFLSAAADPGDERGLRHFRPLHDHEPAVRPRPDQRRRHARNPAQAYQRGLSAGVRRSALFAASTPMRSASP